MHFTKGRPVVDFPATGRPSPHADGDLLHLAKILFDTMERMAPGGPEDPSSFEEAPQWERDLYCLGLRAVLREREIALRVLAQDDDVGGSA